MRTMRIEVSRTGAKSLITEDRMRVDVELEFYLRVQPTVDGVATAAQAIGSQVAQPRRRPQPARRPLHRRDPGDRRAA